MSTYVSNETCSNVWAATLLKNNIQKIHVSRKNADNNFKQRSFKTVLQKQDGVDRACCVINKIDGHADRVKAERWRRKITGMAFKTLNGQKKRCAANSIVRAQVRK